jgi:curli production assembly/transport component CsgE
MIPQTSKRLKFITDSPVGSSFDLVGFVRFKSLVMVVCLCSCLLHLPGVSAGVGHNEAANDSDEEAILQDEGIRGLIVDNTVTMIGKKFYEAFALDWLDQKIGDIDNLAIGERPTARSGSRVWVEYNRRVLFEVSLSPVMANIETTARIAASKVGRRIQEFEIRKALIKNSDLAGDEF